MELSMITRVYRYSRRYCCLNAHYYYTAIIVAAFALTGCATPILSSLEASSNAFYQSRSVQYYALPKGIVDFELHKTKNGYFMATSVRYEPDPQHLYYVNYHNNISTTDKVVVQTDAKGLLVSVQGKSKDELPMLIAKFGELAQEVAKLSALRGDDTTRLLQVVLDPTNKASLAALNERLKAENADLKLEVLEPSQIAGMQCPQEVCNGGIKFRPALPYVFTLKLSNNIHDQAIITLPNEAPILAVDVKRAAFVEKDTQLTFESGMLTKVDISKPSEALGFIQIPIDIVKAIVGIPSALLDFKINVTQKETSLLEQQAAIIKAQQALIEAKKPPATSE